MKLLDPFNTDTITITISNKLKEDQ